jgi:hypothetical protein
MKLRHAAALAFLGWYLMTPMVFIPNRSNDPRPAFDNYLAPLSAWETIRSFDSSAECEKERDSIIRVGESRESYLRENPHPKETTRGLLSAEGDAWRHAVCVASDDLRLKEK